MVGNESNASQPAWEGFRVRSPEGHLGFVERVERDRESGRPVSVAVRAGRIIVLVVPVEEIQAVLPDESTILLGPNATRLVPDTVGDDLVLRPAAPSRSLAAA